MKKILMTVLMTALVLTLVSGKSFSDDDSGTFRGKWWNYYDRGISKADQGDWENWLAFFLRGIAEVSAQATETARRILVLREQHRALITAHLGRAAGNGHRVLEHLYERPIVTVEKVREIIGATYPAANQLVRKLAEHGILSEVTGQKRHRRFRYEAYIRLFDEPEPPDAG